MATDCWIYQTGSCTFDRMLEFCFARPEELLLGRCRARVLRKQGKKTRKDITMLMNGVAASLLKIGGKSKISQSCQLGSNVITVLVQQLKGGMQRSFLSPLIIWHQYKALLLHHKIRLLDGYVRQRADAESDEAVLISNAKHQDDVLQFLSVTTEKA